MDNRSKVYLVVGMVFIVLLTSYATFTFATSSISDTTIESGSMVTTASYIVFTDGSTYYDKNGITGAIDYSGSDAATTIQYAINHLTAGRTKAEKISLVGTFTFTTVQTVAGLPYLCIQLFSYTILDLTNAKLQISDSLPYPLNIIFVGKVGVSTTDVKIIGGEINGNKANQDSDMNTAGIRFSRTSNTKIDGTYIYDVSGQGIFLYGSSNNDQYNNQILNCRVYNSVYEGIKNVDSSHSLFTHNILFNNTYGKSGGGANANIEISAPNCIVSSNLINSTAGFGIDLNPYGTNCIISDNQIYSYSTNDIVGYSMQSGIQLYHLGNSSNIVKGNVIVGASQGIVLVSSSYNIVSDNICKNLKTHGTQYSYGIEVHGIGTGERCYYNLLSNNILFDDQVDHTMLYGIYCFTDLGGAVDYVFVTNCVVKGSVTAGISVIGVNSHVTQCWNETSWIS